MTTTTALPRWIPIIWERERNGGDRDDDNGGDNDFPPNDDDEDDDDRDEDEDEDEDASTTATPSPTPEAPPSTPHLEPRPPPHNEHYGDSIDNVDKNGDVDGDGDGHGQVDEEGGETPIEDNSHVVVHRKMAPGGDDATANKTLLHVPINTTWYPEMVISFAAVLFGKFTIFANNCTQCTDIYVTNEYTSLGILYNYQIGCILRLNVFLKYVPKLVYAF